MVNSSHARRLAYVIGQALLDELRASPNTGDEKQADWSLYGGRAGTLLFLLELSRAFPEGSLLRQLNDLMDDVPTSHGKASAPHTVSGLHDGVAGLAVLCARAGQVLGRADLSAHARDMALWTAEQPCEASEWGNGLAGVLFGVSYVRSRVQCERLDAAVERLQGELVSRACRWPHGGVVFQLRPHEVHPVCGFAHGTSGVAYALLSSTGVRHSEEVLAVVDAAADYDAQLEARYGQWPDLRRPAYDAATVAELEQAYLRGEEAPFLHVFEPSDSWCNGSTGMGFLRCALVEKGLRTQARCELAAAIRSTRRWLPMRHEACLEDFTLCHALGGSCTFLMEVAHVTGCLAAKNAASRLMTPALSRTGEEQAASIVANLGPGLFKGAAGVAWVLLQVSESTCVCPLRLDARSAARVVARRSSGHRYRHQPARATEASRLDEPSQTSRRQEPMVRSLALLAIHRRVQRRAAKEAIALSDDELLASSLYSDPAERWQGSLVTRFCGLGDGGAPLVETVRRSDLIASVCCAFRGGASVGVVIDEMTASIDGTGEEIVPRLLCLVRKLLSTDHLNAVRSPLVLLEDESTGDNDEHQAITGTDAGTRHHRRTGTTGHRGVEASGVG